LDNGWDHGIYLDDSNGNLIEDNAIINNDAGIYLYYSGENNITGNTINSNYLGVNFHLSSSNLIMGNIITSNYREGIYLCTSYSNIIIDNEIIDNSCGIYLTDHSSNNDISDNNLSNNGNNINLYQYSCCNIIIRNNLSNSNYGIRLNDYSNNNLIYHNNFIKNEQNAQDGCANIWDDGKFGNYWDDFKEKYPKARKLFLKGIWNTPYEIPEKDNKDTCPLIKQWPHPHVIIAAEKQTTHHKPVSIQISGSSMTSNVNKKVLISTSKGAEL
jgi:parallel beta-helix repeat protein